MAQVALKKEYNRSGFQSAKGSSLKATIRDQSGAGKKRVGELLSKEGYITSTQLDEAIKYQEKNPGRLSSILVRLGYVDEETIVKVLSRLNNYPIALPSKLKPDPEALKVLAFNTAKNFMAFPIKLNGDTLEITMSEPTDTDAVERLQTEIHKSLRVFISAEKDIVEAYREHYRIDDEEYAKLSGGMETETEEEDIPITQVDDFGSLVSEAVDEIELAAPSDEDDISDEFSAGDAPIIKLVNGILIRAMKG